MSSDRPKILVVVDAPDWAQDFKTRQLQAALGADYDFTKRYNGDVADADIDAADLILVHYWLQIERLPDRRAAFTRNRERLLLGVCSHRELADQWRDPGLAMLAELPRAVFAVNRRLYDECRRLLGVPVFCTPNGVATDVFCPHQPSHAGRDGPLRVGWAGSLNNHGSDYRGFDNFIVPAVRAVDGAELAPAVREQVLRGHDEMVDYYRSLDVYVCASISEGTPNTCLEAAACGVPVVTTRVGSMPELIRDGHNGFFVERQIADIASKLKLLRDNPLRRAEIGRNLRRSVRDWDWKKMAENYRRMFQSVLRA